MTKSRQDVFFEPMEVEKMSNLSEEEKKAIKELTEIKELVEEDLKFKDYEVTAILDQIDLDSLVLVLNLIEKQQKEIYCLKNKVHISKCSICGKEFEHKRSNCKFCKDCSKKEYNHNYFKNMSEDKKRKRREYSKLYMRRIRGYKKENE